MKFSLSKVIVEKINSQNLDVSLSSNVKEAEAAGSQLHIPTMAAT